MQDIIITAVTSSIVTAVAYTLFNKIKPKQEIQTPEDRIVEIIARKPKTYCCTCCNTTLKLSEFHKNNYSKRGHMTVCKKCSSRKSKKVYADKKKATKIKLLKAEKAKVLKLRNK